MEGNTMLVHYPAQLTFREVVTVTLIEPAEGFLTVLHERYRPSPGEIAAEEGREVAWRCGDSPTTRTLLDGSGGSMVGIVYATLQSAEDRARDRGPHAAIPRAILGALEGGVHNAHHAPAAAVQERPRGGAVATAPRHLASLLGRDLTGARAVTLVQDGQEAFCRLDERDSDNLPERELCGVVNQHGVTLHPPPTPQLPGDAWWVQVTPGEPYVQVTGLVATLPRGSAHTQRVRGSSP